MAFVWLPEAAIIAMHDELLAEHGGLDGAVDANRLASTMARPMQLESYGSPSLHEVAASYGFGFARNHCFSDGNKRIALVAMDVFLQLNGEELSAPEADAVLTIEDLATGDIGEEDLVAWIGEYAIKLIE